MQETRSSNLESSLGQDWVSRELLQVVEPVLLHILGLIVILLIQQVVKLSKPRVLSFLLAVTCSFLIVWLGYVKTSGDPNMFKLLKVQRYPTSLEVQRGLDRLEDMNLLDSESIVEIEAKLAGNASLFFWKSSQRLTNHLRS